MESSTVQILLLSGISVSFISTLAGMIVITSIMRRMRLTRLNMGEIRDTQLNHTVGTPLDYYKEASTRIIDKLEAEKEETQYPNQVLRVTKTLRRHNELMIPERKIG